MTDRQTRIARLLLRVESSRRKFDREWTERADRLMARHPENRWMARLAADYRQYRKIRGYPNSKGRNK
jgi:hypothetical protein